MRRFATGFVLMLALAVTAGPAWGDEVPIATWKERLATASGGSESALASVAATTSVVLADGTRLAIDESGLASLSPVEQRARLTSLEASARALDNTVPPDERATRAASAALADRAFDEDAVGRTTRVRLPRWLESLLGAIGRFVDRFIGGVVNPDLSSPAGWLRMLIGLAVIACMAWLTVRLIRRGSHLGPPDLVDPAEAAHQEPSERLWRKRFHEARIAGDRIEALRCLYLAGLLHLDDRGVVDFRPGRTDALYVVELAERAPVALDAFRRLSSIFARVHYGGEAIDDAGLDAAQQAESEMRDHVQSRPAA